MVANASPILIVRVPAVPTQREFARLSNLPIRMARQAVGFLREKGLEQELVQVQWLIPPVKEIWEMVSVHSSLVVDV